MGTGLHFDDVLHWAQRPAFGRFIFHLKQRLTHRPAIAAVMAKEQVWDSYGVWYFDEVPVEDLHAMLSLADEMAERFDEVFAYVTNPESKQLYWQDLQALRRLLAARIERVERHRTLRPSWPAIVFGPGVYWEAPDSVMQAVLGYLRDHQSEHPDLKEIFTDKPWYSERTAKWFYWVTPEGLRAIGQLLERMERELPQILKDIDVSPEAFLQHLEQLRSVLNARMQVT